MNLAALALAPAGLLGLAAAWFLLDWVCATSAALPGLQPAGPAALPGLLLGLALGAGVGGRAAALSRRSPLVATMRWLAASAAAVIAASWMLSALLPSGGEAVFTGWWRAAASVLPATPATFLLGGALVRLGSARHAQGRSPSRALGGVIAVSGAAAGAGVLLFPGRLLEGAPLVLWSALCLLVAAIGCGALSLFEAPAPTCAAPTLPPLSTPTARTTRGSIRLLAAALAGGLVGAAAPALLRFAGQLRGHDLETSVELLAALAAGLCCGASLVAFPGTQRVPALRAWLLLAPALVPLLSGPAAPLLGAGLLGAGLGATIALPPAPAQARPPAPALACSAAGLALGLLAQSRLRLAGWGSGELLQATALGASGASIVVAAACERWSWRAVALIPGVALAIAAWIRPVPALPVRAVSDDVALIAHVEDPAGVLAIVSAADGGTRRTLDGWSLPSGAAGALAGRRMARLSAAMRPDAKAALVVGAGDGQLLLGLGELLPGRVECVEAIGHLVEEARAAPNPSGATVALPEHADPRAFVASREAAWDLVIIGPQPPGRPGQGAPLALQHLLTLRRALRPDGVVVKWLPLNQMPWPAFASAAQAFLEAFPETRVFVASLRAPEPLVALVGGLEHGLPGVEQLDAFLGAAPSAAGLSGAPDVFDLYVCDGWTLAGRVREAGTSTLEQPLAELLSARREDEGVPLSIMNLRLLAGLATPLDTVSLAARPVQEKEDKELGAQLVARSRALAWLLVAQAARLERLDAAAGSLSADERSALEDEQGASLLAAWSAAPGHVDVQQALLALSAELIAARRWTVADALLAAATGVRADGRLLGLRTGVLIDLGAIDEALRVGRQAIAAAPGDPNALVNLARALLLTAQDDEARSTLVAARAAFAPIPLPPLHAACLALLERAPDARATAEALLAQLPSGESWAAVLRRLLDA